MVTALIFLLVSANLVFAAGKFDIGTCATLVGKYKDTDGNWMSPAKTPLVYERSTLIYLRSYSTQELNNRFFQVQNGTKVKIIDEYDQGQISTRQVQILEGDLKGRTGWTMFGLKDLSPTGC